MIATRPTTSKLPPRKQFKLRWLKPFYPEWGTGVGKGEPKSFGSETLVEITDNHNRKRPRVRVVGTDYQAYVYRDDEVNELEPV